MVIRLQKTNQNKTNQIETHTHITTTTDNKKNSALDYYWQ